MSFASLVSEHLAGLSPAEARVAMFMADHPHSVGHLSAARLAEAADASDATVIRTVRKLGFDGLAALREALAAELSLSGRLEASLGNGRQVGTMRLIGERADAVRALPGGSSRTPCSRQSTSRARPNASASSVSVRAASSPVTPPTNSGGQGFRPRR